MDVDGYPQPDAPTSPVSSKQLDAAHHGLFSVERRKNDIGCNKVHGLLFEKKKKINNNKD